jgi:hypothetical protein
MCYTPSGSCHGNSLDLSKMRQEELQTLVEDFFMAREKDSDQHVKGEQQGEGDNNA